jgi:hypothetical protein
MGYPPTPGLSENRPNLAPPRGSIRGAPDEPPPAGPPHDVTPPPAESPAPAPSPAQPPGMTADARPQSAVVGGNVGPVGSREEKDELGLIVGGQANSATELLLGPLARGTTVHIAPDPAGGR